MLRLVLIFLIAFLTPVIPAQPVEGKPTLLIDGYNASRSFESPADLPLGTTLVLVCRVGLSSELLPNFTWLCLNESCIRKGYAGRNITLLNKHESVLAINITSVHDSGTYTCIVSVDGNERVRKEFELNVAGGKVVHSYGRLILNEGVISDRRQLQPPNNPEGDGMIECSVWSGVAQFGYFPPNPTSDKYDLINDGGSNATVVIKEGALVSGTFAVEGGCAGLFHYLFLNNDTICNNLTFENPTFNGSAITVTLGKLPHGIKRVMVGYTRLDLGVPVEGKYVNLPECGKTTFRSLVSGTKYRITAWGLGGGSNKKRCQSPTEVEVTTRSKVPDKISTLDMTPIIIHCSAGLLIEWEEPKSTSEIIAYNVNIYKGKDMMGSLNTTKKYQLVPGLNTSTVYRVTVAAISMGGKGDEAAYEDSTLSVLGFFAECPSIPIPNIVTFNSNSTIVSESETLLHIDVYRYGQMEGLIELSVKDQIGTAERFEDYVLQSHSLYFTRMGQPVEKATVVVKIINDDEKESIECFELILSTEDNIMFNKKTMTIYIKDDEKDKNMKKDMGTTGPPL